MTESEWIEIPCFICLDPPEGEERIFLLLIRDLACMPFINVCAIWYGEEYGLTADSEPGNGTCIKICIPFTKGEEDMELKILILDDEYIILDGLCSFPWEMYGCRIVGKRWM